MDGLILEQSVELLFRDGQHIRGILAGADDTNGFLRRDTVAVEQDRLYGEQIASDVVLHASSIMT